MIDPKLNEIPIDPDDEIANVPEHQLTAEQREAQGRRNRAGLSINDTIAGSANLSVGARGVDTSGVRAGAGAGAGSTMLTAGAVGESPAPELVGGARGSGTTVLGANDSLVTNDMAAGTAAASEEFEPMDHQAVSSRAYEIWCERGCPHGTSDADWHQAVQEHRASRTLRSTTAGN